MAVIPLTLTISLCLVATFVLFFLRESAHRAFSSAEHDAMLPLADETPAPASAAKLPARGAAPGFARGGRCGCSADAGGHGDHDHDHDHDHGHAQAHARGPGRAPCEGCRRRAEERSRRAPAPAQTVTAGS